MADSTTNLDQVTPGNSAAARVNANFDVASPSMFGGRRASVSGSLYWGYYGGRVTVNGTVQQTNNGAFPLTGSVTNYIEMAQDGSINFVTGTRSPDKMPLYAAPAGGGALTSYSDERRPELFARMCHGIASLAVTTSNVTLSQEQALCETLKITGALTAQRNVVVPLVRRRWAVRHTGSAFGVQIIGSSGTGVVVAAGKTAMVECDGADVYRLTPDV